MEEQLCLLCLQVNHRHFLLAMVSESFLQALLSLKGGCLICFFWENSVHLLFCRMPVGGSMGVKELVKSQNPWFAWGPELLTGDLCPFLWLQRCFSSKHRSDICWLTGPERARVHCWWFGLWTTLECQGHVYCGPHWSARERHSTCFSLLVTDNQNDFWICVV